MLIRKLALKIYLLSTLALVTACSPYQDNCAYVDDRLVCTQAPSQHEAIMGYYNAPQGWQMVTGDWGTDADREETIYLTGGQSLHLKATAVATKLQSDPIPVQVGSLSDDLDITYAAHVVLRSSSISAGNTVTVKVSFLNEVGTELTSLPLVNGVLSAADTWETHSLDFSSASGVTHVRFTVEKSAQSFDVYIDRVDLLQETPNASMTRSGTQAITSAAGWTQIQLPGVIGSQILGSTATDDFTIQLSGVYQINAAMKWSTITSGTITEIRIVINGSTHYYGTVVAAPTANNASNLVSVAKSLDAGDTVSIEVKTSANATINLADSHFTITGFTGE